MKILLCHNHYLQRGGEDQVFADETELLQRRGCDVLRYVRDSQETKHLGRIETVKRTLWNREAFDDIRDILCKERPDVMHCTNIIPLISPAAYDAARVEGVPVVQSLHNFRAICVNGLLMRDGSPCEKCIGCAVPWPGIAHGCYRDSHVASTVLAGTIALQRAKRKSSDPVSLYVALSEFSRTRFIRAGFPSERVVVKSNFVSSDPGPGDGSGDYAIFVGRLSEEKGLDVLLDAWSKCPYPIRLKIVGDGPLSERVKQAANQDQRIEWLGMKPIDEVYELIGDASFLVLPSICYENCPKTILEAYSKGTPAIVSRHGAMQEYVIDGRTGLHFDPGSASDLADKVQRLFVNVALATEMRSRARSEFEEKYTADANFTALMSLYQRAMGNPVVLDSAQPLAVSDFGNGTASADVVVSPAIEA